MGEFNVRGSDLKALIKLARKQPLGFAFNPGKNPKEDYFGIDRRKPAEFLMKKARSEGPSKKVAFGTCSVDGKVMSLTCTKELPAMAKKLKAYFKSEKISLNIRILDADGNELEADIEELEGEDEDAAPGAAPTPPAPDAKQKDEPDAAAQQKEEPKAKPEEKDEKPAEPQKKAEPEAEPKTAPDAAELAELKKRLAGIGQQIKGIGQPAAPLAKPFKALVQLVQNGDTERAAAGMDKVEAALDKISKSRLKTPPSDDLDSGPEKQRVISEATSPAAAEWQKRRAEIVPVLARAMKTTPASAAKLKAAWDQIAALADQNRHAMALAQARKFEPILKRMSGDAGAGQSGKPQMPKGKQKRLDGLKDLEKRADALMSALAA